MSQPKLLLVLLAGLLGGLAIYVAGSASRDDSNEIVGDETEATVPIAGDSDVVVRRGEEPISPEPALPPAPPEETAKAADPLLQVVDAQTKEPLAGVHVRFVRLELIQELSQSGQFVSPSDMNGLDTVGQFTSDAQGFIFPPPGWYAGSVTAFVAQPRLVGSRELRRPRPTVLKGVPKLRLETRDPIFVRVLWQDGQPRAGVVVSFATHFPELRHPDGTSPMQAYPVGKTDENGRAAVSFPQGMRERFRAGKRSVEYFLMVTGIFEDPPRVSIDPLVPPEAELEITLPACGSVELTLSDPYGERLPLLGKSGIRAAHHGWSTLHRPFATLAPDRRSVSYFPVAIGEVIVATYTPTKNEGWTKVESEGIGPNDDGVTARIDLVVRERTPVLVGRILDPKGEPFANQRIHFSEECFTAYQQGPQHREYIDTDAAGRFRIAWADRSGARSTDRYGVPFLREMTVTPVGKRDVRDPLLCARAKLPMRTGESPHDLGDLIFQPIPFLVGGRVEKNDGNAVKHFQLTLTDAPPPQADRRMEAQPKRLYVRQRMRRSTNDASTFRVHGLIPPTVSAGDLFISASSKALLPTTPTPFRVGDDDLVLRTEAYGVIKGRITGYEENFARHHEKVTLNLRSLKVDEDGGMLSDFTSTNEKGEFEFPRVFPGRYTLTFLSEHRVKLHERSPIAIDWNETVDLGAIDVETDLSTYEIEVRLAPGGPTTKKTWIMIHRENNVMSGRQVDVGYALKLRHFSPPARITVKAEGYRSASLEVMAGRTVVTLTPAIQVEIVAEISEVEFPPRMGLEYSLEATSKLESPSLNPEAIGSGFGTGTRFRIHVPGTYSVRAQLSAPGVGSHYSLGHDLGGPIMTIEVTEDGQQTFKVPDTEEFRTRLREGIAAFEKRIEDDRRLNQKTKQ